MKKLITSVRKNTGLRLIMPIGMNVRLGDILTSDRSGNLTHHKSMKDLPTVPRSVQRRSRTQQDFVKTNGRKTEFNFRPSVEAASNFPGVDFPHGCIDVSIGSQSGWLLSANRPKTTFLTNVDDLATPLADAAALHDWDDGYAIVTHLVTVDSAVVFAARGSSVRGAIDLGASVPTGAPITARFGLATQFVSVSQESMSEVLGAGSPLAIIAKRVKTPGLLSRFTSPLTPRGGRTKNLQGPSRPARPAASAPADFWVDIDGEEWDS